MGYEWLGRMHAAWLSARGREGGQGTVEYVALILLVAVVLAGVVAATRGKSFGATQIAETIVQKIREAMSSVGAGH